MKIFCPLKEFLFLCMMVRFLIVNVCCLSSHKNTVQLLSYQLFLANVFPTVRLSRFFRIFAPQPDEEAGSAEEQPASNMAVPTLKAVDESRPTHGRLTAFRRARPLRKPKRQEATF